MVIYHALHCKSSYHKNDTTLVTLQEINRYHNALYASVCMCVCVWVCVLKLIDIHTNASLIIPDNDN